MKLLIKNRNFIFLCNEAAIKTGRGCNYGNLGMHIPLKILIFFFFKILCWSDKSRASLGLQVSSVQSQVFKQGLSIQSHLKVCN